MTNFAKIIEAGGNQILVFVDINLSEPDENGIVNDNPKLVVKVVLNERFQADMILSFDESNPDGARKAFDVYETNHLPKLLKAIESLEEQIVCISDEQEDVEFPEEIVLEGELDDEEQDELDSLIFDEEDDDNLLDNPRNCSCGNSLGWDGLNEVWFCECTKLYHNDNGEVGTEFTEEEYELEEFGDDDLDEVIYESEEDDLDLIEMEDKDETLG